MVDFEIGSVSVSLITTLVLVVGVSVMCCCCFLLAPSYKKVNEAREVPFGGKNSRTYEDAARTRSNSEKEEESKEVLDDVSIA